MVGAGPLYKTKIVSWTFHNCIGQVKFLGGKWNFDATCPTGQVAKNLILHHCREQLISQLDVLDERDRPNPFDLITDSHFD